MLRIRSVYGSGIMKKIIIFGILFFLCFSFVNAVGISVTRATLDFENVLKGGYAEQTFFVSTDAPFSIPLTYELSGEMANWTTISPDMNAPNMTIFVNNTKYQPVTVIIQPPSDIPAGTYTGAVRVITGAINQPGGQYGSQLQAAFLVKLSVVVTGQEILSCSGAGIILRDTEIGQPLEYDMMVSNNGNIRVRPNITVDIWNQDQSKLVMSKDLLFNNVDVLPTTTGSFTNTFTSDLRIGQYWGYVTVHPCENTALVTFNVYDKGTLVDTGEFVRLDSKPWASVGEVVPLTAVFKNTGQRMVSAKFKGVVTLDNRIVDTIDTEYYDISPGQIGNIDFYYTPKNLGQYVITGRILYNNKLSFEKSTVINVNQGTPESGFNWLYIIIIVVILIIIILLVRRIREKKKRIHRL